MTLRRALAWSFVGALTGVLATSTPVSAQLTGSEVERVNFEGNANFSDSQLRQIILTRQTECRALIFAPFCWLDADFAERTFLLNPLVIPRDAARIRGFYGIRGYRYAGVTRELEYAPDSSTVGVTFIVEEDEPVLINSLDIAGVDEVAETDRGGLLDRLNSGVGRPLDWVGLGEDADSIETRLQNRGYAYAEVFPGLFIPNSAPYEAEVTLDVFAGPTARVGPISVEGNESLSDEVVRRMLPFEEGGQYRREDMLSAQRNLYSLELVRSANVVPDLSNSGDTIIPIAVTLTEGDLRRINWGGGVSTADCLNSNFRWTNRNYKGGGRRLLVRASLSNIFAESLQDYACYQAGTGEFGVINWSVGSEFTQPWFFGVRNSLNTSVFVERQTLKDVFVRRTIGASATVSRSLSAGAAASVAFRPEFVELAATDQFFCTSFVVCNPSDIAALEQFNWLSPAALTVTRTRTDQLFNPTRGSSLLVDVEFARDWTGSAFGYNRVVGEGSWYRALGRDVIAAMRLRSGLVTSRGFSGAGLEQQQAEIVHPQKRFYGGGANSVRGYAQGQLGPRIAVVPLARLIPTQGPGICTPEEIVALTCDASALAANNQVIPRPSGGNGLFVGNAELRVRLSGPSLQGVFFVDAGQVWENHNDVGLGGLAVSPGFGIRYFSPIGPIRFDVGYRTEPGDLLQVVTEQIRAFDPAVDDPEDQILGMGNTRLPYVRTPDLAVLTPLVLFDEATKWRDRLQFHISIGQAF